MYVVQGPVRRSVYVGYRKMNNIFLPNQHKIYKGKKIINKINSLDCQQLYSANHTLDASVRMIL